MSKIGPKEQALRDLRTDIPTVIRRGHPDCKFKDQPRSKAKPKSEGVTLAPPPSVQKAIAADFAEPDPEPTTAPASPAAEPTERTMSKKTTKKTSARKPKKTAAAKKPKATPSPDGVRAGSKLAIVVDLLKRPEGCTGAEVLAATGWPSVSMPQQAKAAGLTLSKEKNKGEPTRYRAA